jgi:ankyrin repeat protein
MSALSQAIINGNVTRVKTLLNTGENFRSLVLLSDSRGLRVRETPLHTAVRRGNSAIVSLLIKQGASILARDELGRTPLHVAVMFDIYPIAMILLKYASQRTTGNYHRLVNLRDQNEKTPLFYAISKKDRMSATISPKMVRLLLKHGANVNIKDEYGYAPLHYAVESGDLRIVSILVDAGARTNVKDNDGDTPLHLTWHVYTEDGLSILRFLIERGANINAKNNWGHTLLHLTSSWGNINFVRELLHQGANPFLKNNGGWTPLELAKNNDHKEIAKLLESWPAERNRRRLTALKLNASNTLPNLPNNVKRKIFSKTGLFKINNMGRPLKNTNTRKRKRMNRNEAVNEILMLLKEYDDSAKVQNLTANKLKRMIPTSLLDRMIQVFESNQSVNHRYESNYERVYMSVFDEIHNIVTR